MTRSPHLSPRWTRRQALGGLLLLPSGLLLPAGLGGCAALAGEETIDAFFNVRGSDSDFAGWTEYNFDEAPDADQAATLERVMLNAPAGVPDLTFITSLLAEAVQPDGTRTKLAIAGTFPKNDTIAPLDVVFDGNLRPLLYPDGRKLRIEWHGTFDTSYPLPEGGVRVEAQIVIEIL